MSKKEKTGLNADLSWDSIKALFAKKPKVVTDKDGNVVDSDAAPEDFVPTLPSVDLLPPKVKEAYAAKDLLIRFMKVGIGIVILFALIFAGTVVSGLVYKSKIASIKADTTGYQEQSSQLAPVAAYLGSINTKRQDIYGQVSQQVDMAKVAKDFTKISEDSGFTVTSFSLGITTTSTSQDGNTTSQSSTCSNPNPFSTETGIGCINFELKAGKDADLAKLYSKIDDSKSGFVNIFVPSHSSTDNGETVTGSVAIKDSFYTQKYLDLQNTVGQDDSTEGK